MTRRSISIMVCIVGMCVLSSGCASEEAFGSDDGFQDVIDRFSSAWQRSDPVALAGLFTADATLVIPDGQFVEGRRAIESFYRGAFDAGYAGSRVEGTLRHSRRFRRDIAIVDIEWRIRVDKAGGDERGILSGILVETGHKWSIAALREQSGATTIQRGGS